MKTLKPILITLLCGAAILLAGYTGIIFGGEWVLTNPTEPELVTMRGNASSLFYSRLEDDIQLYPWNYYPQNADEKTLSEQELDMEEGFFLAYNPYLETDLFYVLISIAADVTYEEVDRWYEEQQKTIVGSMVKGETDERQLPLYFYEDILTLRGTDYEVRISCEQVRITSFSCIPCRDVGIKETEEWKENQEQLTERLEKHSEEALQVYFAMYDLYYTVDIAEDWGDYLAIYVEYVRKFGEQLLQAEQEKARQIKEEDSGSKETEVKVSEAANREIYDSLGIVDIIGNDVDDVLNSMQVIELQDSILLVLESDLTVGLYYDVLRQRIVGFHFLDNYLRL